MGVQNLSKSVKICRSYWQKFAATFLCPTVYGGCLTWANVMILLACVAAQCWENFLFARKKSYSIHTAADSTLTTHTQYSYVWQHVTSHIINKQLHGGSVVMTTTTGCLRSHDGRSRLPPVILSSTVAIAASSCLRLIFDLSALHAHIYTHNMKVPDMFGSCLYQVMGGHLVSVPVYTRSTHSIRGHTTFVLLN